MLDGSHLNNNILQNIHVLDSLKALSLNDCRLTGTLPTQGWCDLRKVEVLVFSENTLEGELISCLANLSSLYHLDISDISENQLNGDNPNWVGTLLALRVLILKANFFNGEIPIELCKLHSLSIIVLSQNNLSGPISFCLSNLTPEPNDEKSSTRVYLEITSESLIADYSEQTKFERSTFGGLDEVYVPFFIENPIDEHVDYMTKRASYIYKGNVLRYMSRIDLSCNRLTGEIPIEIGNLSEIRSLNMSHNNLVGNIPSKFSMLNKLESLDLSHKPK
ncbi:hypothetical protein PVK06_036645 [Gossypium arboreum]|uniref:Uncharacterized protein n=1 Tax=Gossypium arboreum TaxID=29729 RepID=A0ABR0NLA8_GOSAR|nr:hypothetical protein PVK06_036645 [Gossypium arboreum]